MAFAVINIIVGINNKNNMEPTAKDRAKCSTQRFQAKKRGIQFNLTFDQWWAWWQATGHYHERGCKAGQYVMARIGDNGPYDLANIFCCLCSDNVRAAHIGKPEGTRKPKSAADRAAIGNRIRARHKAKNNQSSLDSPPSERTM